MGRERSWSWRPTLALGEEPAAEAELEPWVKGRLAAAPVKIAFWPETLPRNANGKILKSELKKVFAAEGA